MQNKIIYTKFLLSIFVLLAIKSQAQTNYNRYYFDKLLFEGYNKGYKGAYVTFVNNSALLQKAKAKKLYPEQYFYNLSNDTSIKINKHAMQVYFHIEYILSINKDTCGYFCDSQDKCDSTRYYYSNKVDSIEQIFYECKYFNPVFVSRNNIKNIFTRYYYLNDNYRISRLSQSVCYIDGSEKLESYYFIYGSEGLVSEIVCVDNNNGTLLNKIKFNFFPLGSK